MCVSGSVADLHDGVGDRQADRGVEQDRVSFGPGPEIRHPSLADSPRQPATKCLSFFPAGDEDDGFGVGYRERLGEHREEKGDIQVSSRAPWAPSNKAL